MDDKKKQALNLVGFMIEISEFQDAETKTKTKTESTKAGEGWMTFHLKRLKELIENDWN
tara:strand:+ start:32 stop:208 length:177 start_codon:yes stop_codon:yes gene_type:complete